MNWETVSGNEMMQLDKTPVQGLLKLGFIFGYLTLIDVESFYNK